MTYSVREIYLTLQGEGFHSGRPAVFLRFAGCNLWSGREQHRREAVCRFCDTEFVGTDGPGGGKFESAAELAHAIAQHWPYEADRRFVVCTGGEPLLQLDTALIDELHQRQFEIAVETNGTLPAPPGIDWLCVSPKGSAPLQLTRGDELKLVYPQVEEAVQPERFLSTAFTHFFLQPLHDEQVEDNTRACVDYCLRNPKWQLSLQTHKLIGID